MLIRFALPCEQYWYSWPHRTPGFILDANPTAAGFSQQYPPVARANEPAHGLEKIRR
jgi:hypothetical protein